MVRRLTASIILLAMTMTTQADNYTTNGDGTTWTFKTLADIPGSNVYKGTNDGVFYINASLTIATGDTIVLTTDVRQLILAGADTRLVVLGNATWEPVETLKVSFDNPIDNPTGYETSTEIILEGDNSENIFRNTDFTHVGIKTSGTASLTLTDCSFTGYNGDDAGVVYMANSSGKLTVSSCTFRNNERPAIANSYGSANTTLIEDCLLLSNAQNNKNTPQINLVASDQIVIRGCHIIGDPELTMVGGIGVANWTGQEGPVVVLEDNIVEGCRYGVTTMGPTNVTIHACQLLNNDRETNANNGGSGISIYDPYYKTRARISNNRIEGNLWGITVIGGGDINLGCIEKDSQPVGEDDEEYCSGENIFVNNGNGGLIYDLYNNGLSTIYAQNNCWNTLHQTAEEIEQVITHHHDDVSLGEVIFMPPMNVNGIHDISSDRLTTTGILSDFLSTDKGFYDLHGRHITNSSHLLPHNIYIAKGRKILIQ